MLYGATQLSMSAAAVLTLEVLLDNVEDGLGALDQAQEEHEAGEKTPGGVGTQHCD